MKQIIDGKTYNTETATRIASWDNGVYGNDFRACDESLYISPRGTYFLAGEGGALSKYSKSVGNGQTGGSGMEVLTKAEALKWCEEHDVDADTITARFEVEEG